MSSADHVTIQRLALELATKGVSSVALARTTGRSVQVAHSKLSTYARRGLLTRDSGTGRRGRPYVYRVTAAGKRRLQVILKQPAGEDFGPLLLALGCVTPL